MKLCKTCGQTKTLDLFTKRGGDRPDQYQNTCNDCRYLVMGKKKRHMGELVKRWKLRKGCQLCGFKALHSCQLDVDHIVPKRSRGNDRQAINTSWSKLRLKIELSGCQVLCANCHRLKTYNDGTMFQKKIRICE